MPQKKIMPTLARAYVSDAIPTSRAHQVEMCAEAVAAIDGLPALDKVYGPAEADAFIRDLRPTEVAVLSRVLALDERPTPSGMGVGAALAERIVAIEGACLYVVDATAKLRSTDRKWVKHRRAAIATASRGRTLPSEKAKKMQRKSVKVRGSIVEHWRALDGTALYRRIRQHWQDQEMTAEEAVESAPEEAGPLGSASVSTWTRIFGPRTKNTKRASRRRT